MQRCRRSSYLWHDDRFTLRSDSGRCCLLGEVHYGDNAEDEWYVVAILKKITEEEPQLAARVEDSDGEVLLIEAADVLPRWAQEPEVAGGRVFLHRGEVHLVPIADRPSLLSPFPWAPQGENDAFADPGAFAKVVTSNTFCTKASEDIQLAIKSRLKKMPSDWQENLHYVHALLPLKTAQMLHQSPQLISCAVHRVLSMDFKDAKICRSRMKANFKCVKTGVQFTKCLFAMLQSHALHPTKESGWPTSRKGSEEWKVEQLGFKISAGIELLASDIERIGVEGCPSEKAYLKRLEDLGYFRQLLPGSKEYETLKRSARFAFLEGQCEGGASKQDAKLAEFKECFQKAERYKAVEEEERTDKLLRMPDDDAWLHHDQESLDKLLKKHFHIKAAEEPAVLDKLGHFLSSDSDMRGVEVDEDKPIDIDVDGFEQAMEKVLGTLVENGAEDVSSDELEGDSAAEEAMEKELLSSNVKEGDELLHIVKNLTKEMAESSTGPSRTILQTVRK